MATFVDQGLTKSVYHLRPSLQIKPVVNIPFNHIPGTFRPNDDTPVTFAVMKLVPVLYIWLDTLLDENAAINPPPVGKKRRSIMDDQLDIFNQIEKGVSAFGVDGKHCLMRAICELQSHPMGKFSVIGEVLTVLLTPKRSVTDSLHDYIEAEETGRSIGDYGCEAKYDKCPVSIFNMFKGPPTDLDLNQIEEDFDTDDDFI